MVWFICDIWYGVSPAGELTLICPIWPTGPPIPPCGPGTIPPCIPPCIIPPMAPMLALV